MTKRTAYLFHLLTDSKMESLRASLLKTASDNLMKPEEEHPIGFLCEKEKPAELSYFEDHDRHLLFLQYYWWSVKPYLDHQERRRKAYYPHPDPVVVDLETRIMYVYTSQISDAIRIAKTLAAQLTDPPFELIYYRPNFIRWLAEEGQDRSKTIINVGKTKFDKVDSLFSDTRRLVIEPTLQVRDSHFWTDVRSGKIVYSECTFRISDVVLPILVYSVGKYTLIETKAATPQQIGHFLRHVYLELDRLLSVWQKESKAWNSQEAST